MAIAHPQYIAIREKATPFYRYGLIKRAYVNIFDLRRFCVKIIMALALMMVMIKPPLALALNEFQEVTSPSGIKAWLNHDKTSKLLAINFIFKGSGAIQESAQKAGLANLLSGLIDEGAGENSSIQVRKILEDHSITMSFQADYDHFSGKLNVLKRYLPIGAKLLGDALHRPIFADEPLERIRAQIITGLRQQASDPNQIAAKALNQQVFGDHAYARKIEGDIKSVTALSRTDLSAYMQENLVKSRLLVGVSGPIDPVELGILLDEIFKDLPQGKPAIIPKAMPNLQAVNLDIPLKLPQASLLFALPGVMQKSPDFYKMMVLNHILGGGSFESYLMQEVREKRGLVYGVYSYLYNLEGAALLRGGMATRTKTIAEAKRVTENLLQKIADNGPSPEAVAAAKDYLIGSYNLAMTNSPAIAARLAGLQSLDLPINYITIRPSLFAPVTTQNLHELAKKILDLDQLVWVTVGDVHAGS